MNGYDFLKRWLAREGMTSVEIRREEMQQLVDEIEALDRELTATRKALLERSQKKRCATCNGTRTVASDEPYMQMASVPCPVCSS